jgi:CMP-N,N'-diacetyllegionaminic acid synthase
LPRKNVALLGGKPLVAWAIETALAAKTLDQVVVSSDDDEVLDIANQFVPRLGLRRPAELATDSAPAIDYVIHALAVLEEEGAGPFDAVAILQPTSPFTLAMDIDHTVQLLERSGADSAVSVMEVDHVIHPVKLKRMEGDRILPFYEDERGRMAASDLPRAYVRNCSVYVTRRASIDRSKIIGDDCRGYAMPRVRSLDINEQMDLDFAKFLQGQLSRSSLDQ